jgi:hypothetical protein
MTDVGQELTSPLARTLARTPNQDQSRSMLISLARMGLRNVIPVAVGGATHGVGAAPFYAASALGQTAGGARFLTGQQGWQKSLTNAFDSPATDDVTFANLLRAMRDNASNQGASFTGN